MSYPILAGLTAEDVQALRIQCPDMGFWDAFRERVEGFTDQEEDIMVMSLYHLMNQQASRIRWINEVVTYSWIDAALFLEAKHPSYVANFCIHFQKVFLEHSHYAFYEIEADALRFNRVLPGIRLFKRAELTEVVKKLINSAHT